MTLSGWFFGHMAVSSSLWLPKKVAIALPPRHTPNLLRRYSTLSSCDWNNPIAKGHRDRSAKNKTATPVARCGRCLKG